MKTPESNVKEKNSKTSEFLYINFCFLFFGFLSWMVSVSPVSAEKLCSEKLGSYYVNIGLKNDSFGMGLEDAFEVEITKVRPATEGELDAFKAFNYYAGKDEKGAAYPDGRQYIWKKEGNAYRLYKNVSGRKPVRLEVYVVKFAPDKKLQYLMRLRNSNPSMYTQLALDSKLEVLGVMGVFMRGSNGAVDFINNSTLEAASASPKAYVRNADVMLYRFAFSSGYDGTDNNVGPADWKDFNKALSKRNEQYLLDNIPAFYQGYGFIDDRMSILKKFGDITVSGMQDGEIKYVFQQCIPSGDLTYGSAKTAFVPVMVKDGDKSYYPLFVFPAAFSSPDVFFAEIRKASLRARWWNAGAFLSGDKYSDNALLRESLLRYTFPHMEADISLENYGTGGKTASDPQVFGVYFSLKPVQSSAFEAIMNDYRNMANTAPWAVANNLTIPESNIEGNLPMIRSMADVYYNNALAAVMPDVTKFKSTPKTLDDKQKKKVIENLVDAVTNGYVRTADLRNKILALGMNEFATPVYLADSWKKIADENKVTAVSVIKKISSSGFMFSDLEWLYLLTSMPNLPFQSLSSDKFATRLKYLVATKGIKSIDKLEDAVKNPILQINVGEAAEMTDNLATKQQKADAAFADASNNAAIDANKREQLKADIKKLSDDLKALNDKVAAKWKEHDDAQKAYDDFFSTLKDKKQKAYDDMKTKCSTQDQTFAPDLDMSAVAMIENVPKKIRDDQAVYLPCNQAILKYYEARREFKGADQDPKYQAVQNKSEEIVALNELIYKMGARIDELSGSKLTDIDTDYLKNIGAMKAYSGKSRYTWKSWIRDSFMAYFTFGEDDAAAYDALDKNLKLAGVTLVTAGGAQ